MSRYKQFLAVAVSLLIWTTGCGQNAQISETTESLEKQRVAAVEAAFCRQDL